MSLRKFLEAVFTLSLCFYPATKAFSQARHPEPLSEERRGAMALQLRGSGVDITEAALIDALLHKGEMLISDSAARMLTTLPKTPTSVAALRAALSAPNVPEFDLGWAPIVESAAWALAQMGDTGWEDTAVAQLHKMSRASKPESVWQVLLAGVLANAGRADGWPVVQATLASNDPFTVGTALVQAEYFDQLKDPVGGQPIDVLAELTKLSSIASDAPTGTYTTPPVRKQFEKKIADMKAIKSKKK